MKRIVNLCLFMAFCVGLPTYAHAQITKEQKKEREILYKSSKKELEAKATKVAIKDAKAYRKDGYKVVPGALPLEKQLDKSYLMQYEYDANLCPKYIMGEAKSIGGNYDAAKTQAMELATQNLAGQIQTEVTALVENTVANEQLSHQEAVSVTRSISASLNLISQSIGRTLTVIECYRELSNKNVEVLVRIAYSSDMALQVVKRTVKQNLEEKGDGLHNKLDKAMGW